MLAQVAARGVRVRQHIARRVQDTVINSSVPSVDVYSWLILHGVQDCNPPRGFRPFGKAVQGRLRQGGAVPGYHDHRLPGNQSAEKCEHSNIHSSQSANLIVMDRISPSSSLLLLRHHWCRQESRLCYQPQSRRCPRQQDQPTQTRPLPPCPALSPSSPAPAPSSEAP